MNLISKLIALFGGGVAEPKSEYHDWTVEFYPETGRYFPIWKRKWYVKKHYLTGIYQFREPFLFMYCDYGKTEDEAWRMIDLVKEQRFKENVKVLTR